uniref:Uncharacterized protein n=1 Tax=Anguilla anguilla TaxID=7936 RepID=A0A0E9U481_ANGAN
MKVSVPNCICYYIPLKEA